VIAGVTPTALSAARSVMTTRVVTQFP
jgi:hypothetical protein